MKEKFYENICSAVNVIAKEKFMLCLVFWLMWNKITVDTERNKNTNKLANVIKKCKKPLPGKASAFLKSVKNKLLIRYHDSCQKYTTCQKLWELSKI